MKIESEDIDIENLLISRFFKIPRFQRPYSWDEDNITELWDDVIAARGDDYFIGSMVVFKEGKQYLSMVDGQQRLTTITLLLCAIRDAFAANGNMDLAEGVHQLIERKNRENRSESVLKSESSFPYLQDQILRFGMPQLKLREVRPEEFALKRAHEILKSKIQEALDAIETDSTIPSSEKTNEKDKKLRSIRDSILNLKVILVKLENEDDAYLIFETLNTRGKDLAATDLFKNHFAKLLKQNDDTIDIVKEKWSTILETITESSANLVPDMFLYHFWASRYDAVPLKKLYSVMKSKITTPVQAKSTLNELLQDAEHYRSIHEPTFQWSKNEKKGSVGTTSYSGIQSSATDSSNFVASQGL